MTKAKNKRIKSVKTDLAKAACAGIAAFLQSPEGRNLYGSSMTCNMVGDATVGIRWCPRGSDVFYLEVGVRASWVHEGLTDRERQRNADRVDGYDRDDLGESPDY